MPCTGSLKSGDFDHVVLLVAAQTVLRAEGGRELQVAAGGQRIERMAEVGRDRSGMRQKRQPLTPKRRAKSRLREKAIDAEFHGSRGREKLMGEA